MGHTQHRTYPQRDGFTNEREEAAYPGTRCQHYLEHPEASDLEVMVMESGALNTFIRDYPDDALAAASALYRAANRIAGGLAEADAEATDYDTVMED